VRVSTTNCAVDQSANAVVETAVIDAPEMPINLTPGEKTSKEEEAKFKNYCSI
jgi:hypothetical protein